MKIRSLFVFLVSAFLFAGLTQIPGRAYAAQANDLTKEVMEGGGPSEAAKGQLQVSNPDKKKEVQIRLGDQFKAYILAGSSPFKELNGKPMPGNIRAMFGLHIPLK